MKKIILMLFLIFSINCFSDEVYEKTSFSELEVNRETEYDMNGYDVQGYDKLGWGRSGFNKYTKSKYDKTGYDKNGFSELGLNKGTNDFYDENGYDKNGWSKNGLNKETGIEYDENGYDKNGFNNLGINKETGTKYSINGYDIQGYNTQGYNEFGWGDSDINKYTKTKYDEKGYNKSGFNKFGLNIETNDFYDKNGLDINGYDENGYYNHEYNNPKNLELMMSFLRHEIFFKDITSYDYLNKLETVISDLSKETLTEEWKKYLDIAILKKEVVIKEIIKTTKQIETKYDEFEKISWYSTKYNIDNYYNNYPGLYIGEKNKEKWLIFNFTYYDSDWLFIRKILLKNDTDIMEILPLDNDVVRDVIYGGKIKEKFESNVTNNITRLKKIVNSKTFKIRLVGDNYYEDFDFSKNEIIKENINSIIDKYYELKK